MTNKHIIYFAQKFNDDTILISINKRFIKRLVPVANNMQNINRTFSFHSNINKSCEIEIGYKNQHLIFPFFGDYKLLKIYQIRKPEHNFIQYELQFSNFVLVII